MTAIPAPGGRGMTRASRGREVARALEALRAVGEHRRKPSYLLTRREYVSAAAAEPDLADLPSGPEVAGAFGGWERARACGGRRRGTRHANPRP